MEHCDCVLFCSYRVSRALSFGITESKSLVKVSSNRAVHRQTILILCMNAKGSVPVPVLACTYCTRTANYIGDGLFPVSTWKSHDLVRQSNVARNTELYGLYVISTYEYNRPKMGVPIKKQGKDGKPEQGRECFSPL